MQTIVDGTVPPVTRDLSLPDHVHFGQKTITNDNDEFLEAIGYCIESYCEVEKTPKSAQDILRMLREIIESNKEECDITYADSRAK